MNLTIANTLILLGIIQGFFFGGMYLISRQYKYKSTMYLALLIITFSYNNLQFYISDAKMISGNVMYATFYIPVGSLIPVFIIMYVRGFLYGEETKTPLKWNLLYLPFVIFFLLAVALKIDSIGTINAVAKPIWQGIGKIQSSFSFLYTLALIMVSFKLTLQHKNQKKDKKTLQNIAYTWLQRTLVILFLLSLMWGVALIKYLTNVSFRTYFTTLWIAMSITIYWLGHIGIYKYGIREERKKLRNFSKINSESPKVESSKGNYLDSINAIVKTDKQYLNSNFSAEMLAEELQISKSHLSRVFSNEMNTSFSDYINTLRVEEAKSYLKNPDFSNYTLIAIGLEAGFNSKTTFNTTFKKITGQTPSQFKKSQSNLF